MLSLCGAGLSAGLLDIPGPNANIGCMDFADRLSRIMNRVCPIAGS